MPLTDILDAFRSQGLLVDIVQEKEMYNSLFISYGGSDESYVSKINDSLRSEGVQTWFFPVDSLPGQKLHRAMHDGVNSFDRVLLVCSKNSLQRVGVLNEIERVLEREAREGGSDILIPITLDDFVYDEWSPKKTDIASQIRTRVITKFPKSADQTKEFQDASQKLIKAIRKYQSGG